MPPITKTSQCCGVVRGQRGHIKASKDLKKKPNRFISALKKQEQGLHLWRARGSERGARSFLEFNAASQTCAIDFFFFPLVVKVYRRIDFKKWFAFNGAGVSSGTLLRQYPLIFQPDSPGSCTYCSLWKCLSVSLIGTECASSARVLELYNLSDTLNSCCLFIQHSPNCCVMFPSTGFRFLRLYYI